MLIPQIFQQQILGYHLITVILFYVIYVTMIFSYVRLIFGQNKHIFVAMIECCATVHVLYWIKLMQFDWCEIRLSYKITNKLYLTTIYNEIDGSKKSIFHVYILNLLKLRPGIHHFIFFWKLIITDTKLNYIFTDQFISICNWSCFHILHSKIYFPIRIE